MPISFAWLALTLYILGGTLKTPRHCLSAFLAGNLSYITYYLLSGIYAPAITLSMLSLVTLAIITVPRRFLLPIVILGFALSAALTLAHMQNTIDLTLILAAAFVYFANYNRENVTRFKFATLLGQILWVAFALYHWDIPMLICAGGMSISLGLSLHHHMRQNQLSKTLKPALIAQALP